MFVSRIALFALPALAAAAAFSPNGPSCSTGIQCCKSSEDSHHLSDPTKALLGSLGIDLGSLTALVGLTCVPVTVGAEGPTCAGQALCCQNDNFNGVVALGCNEVTL